MRLSLGSRLILLVMPFSCITTQAQSSHEDPPRWEIGGHYTLLNIASDRVGCLGCGVNNSGLGVNLGVNFHRWIGFDSEINFFPDPGVGATNQEGGRITQGLFGLKAGITREKWGLFAKVRPGFVSNGKAIIAVSPTPATVQFYLWTTHSLRHRHRRDFRIQRNASDFFPDRLGGYHCASWKSDIYFDHWQHIDDTELLQE